MVHDRFKVDTEAQTSKRPAGYEAGEQPTPMDVDMEGRTEAPALLVKDLNYCYGGGATVHTRAMSEPKLIDVNCMFEKGSRVLVAGANGAGKSTLLSIVGGKKMIPSGQCKVFGKECFNDTTLNSQRMYCGDWWRTNFFFNLSVSELVGVERLGTPRVQLLIDVLQINLSWRINAISDGQRRRVQLLECLAEEKQMYVLDEITTDLDLYAREGLLEFLKKETEEKGAIILYATHIFDSLSDWATHVVFFSKAKICTNCRIEDLKEYQAMVSNGTRCPLYTLMKKWVWPEYDSPVEYKIEADTPMAPDPKGPTLEVTNLTFAYAAGLSPCLKDMSFAFNRGARILVVGANGACKSTVMSILGGKRMIPRGFSTILGKDSFNDPSIAREVMYCGDWWNTQFFVNTTIADLIGEELIQTSRAKHLAAVLQVDVRWRINSISDGQRRRCQLLEILVPYRPVYLMDEITSDLDIFAREGILAFLKAESELRGCTIFYCTHIFDHLEGWASHMLHLSKGTVARACPMDEIEEYTKLCSNGCLTPLYSLVRGWMYAEYDKDAGAQPWRDLADDRDGRVPNLGLAGPFQTSSG